MKKINLMLLLLAGGITARAQTTGFLKFYGPSGPVCMAEQIEPLPGGALLTLGTVMRQNQSGQFLRDLLLIKTNNNGDTIWNRYLGQSGASEMGRDFALLPDGKILITGYTVYDMGNQTAGFLICADSTGNELWSKLYQDDSINTFSSLKISGNGIILAGTDNTSGSDDAWLLKTDLNGNVLWSTIVGGTDYDDAWDVETTPEGGYIFTGGTYSFADGLNDDAWMVKTDADGNVIWRKTYGLTDKVDWAWAVVPSLKAGVVDGYVFTGLKNNDPDAGNGITTGDLHLVKTDTAGTVLWDKSVGGPPGSMRREGTDIKQAKDGGFIICTMRFSAAGKPFFSVIKTDTAGNVVYEKELETSNKGLVARAIVEAENGSIFVTGRAELLPSGQEIFIARIDPTATGIKAEPDNRTGITIFPNPSESIFEITANHAYDDIKAYTLYGVDGRVLLHNGNIEQTKVTVDMGSLQGGIMMLKVTSKSGVSIHRVVKK